MKYYLIAGEASGDLHAAPLIEAIKAQDSKAQFRFLGGDLMAATVGSEPVIHYRQMAFMGFVSVVMNLDKVLHNIKVCKRDVVEFAPDVVILVDYPSFNLKIAQHVKEQLPHTQVHYYIPPKIWAWKEHRIKRIKRYVDRVYAILPFEVPFYQRHHYPITYVGNPTVEEVATRPCLGEEFDHFTQRNQLSTQPIIALLPGSRVAEIDFNLPMMLEAASHFPNYQCIIAGAPSIERAYYQPFIEQYPQAKVLYNDTYALLQQATAALVTSGTATLEVALFRLPQVVCYRTHGGALLYHIMRRVLKIDYVSLVNLIADAPVVAELLQHHCTVANLTAHLAPLLSDTPQRAAMLRGYDVVAQRLGGEGAPQHTARLIKGAL